MTSRFKDMNRVIELLPVIISFLVATLLTLSTLSPQVKGSVALKSPEMHHHNKNHVH
ncbi:hypothetical protein [Aetokthonos hydrillicola]|nr:hypothetical protein [Aetokthonos hydrillicola]MBW4585881.1 hypothetical protein [Aetokthonos hydrillicola CCALA 1050]